MNYVSYIACTISGLILCAISFIGIYNIPASPIASLTILLEPSGFGPLFDANYFKGLMVIGFWLILFVWARAAAGAALAMVLFKMIVINGWVPLTITVALCLLLTFVVTISVTPGTTGQDQ
ncbi:hypothetical protein CLV80_10497 [Yoonia maritima]|uniref:Uncharacterized protein n=1 Tax=Yoonia maritima TaxID=1435347 RepID=A0A2T0W037_9RHOB|nr:hypothetical protein CLV80_10497 [Yoonia maritima]